MKKIVALISSVLLLSFMPAPVFAAKPVSGGDQNSAPASELVGYDVTFRNPDGTTGMKRMNQRPGARIALGNKTVNAGYDVSYQLDGETHVVRMDQRPEVDRFKVVDGQVITRI